MAIGTMARKNADGKTIDVENQTLSLTPMPQWVPTKRAASVFVLTAPYNWVRQEESMGCPASWAELGEVGSNRHALCLVSFMQEMKHWRVRSRQR